MTNQGKYKTPVIAELIGTKTRIWGISIRYYEQFNTREVSTFILNPYYELLAPIIKLNPSERKKILIDQLLSGSVSATYTKLLQKGFVGKTINIINYWNLIEYWVIFSLNYIKWSRLHMNLLFILWLDQWAFTGEFKFKDDWPTIPAISDLSPAFSWSNLFINSKYAL